MKNNFFTRSLITAAIAIAIWVSSVTPALANSERKDNPNVNAAPALTLQDFAASLPRTANIVPAGLYISDSVAMPIVQQPSGQPGFVSSSAGVATHFKMAEQFGNIGILAHNHLAGAEFFNLREAQIIEVVMSDGSIAYYQIRSLQNFQALSPNSPTSNYLDEAGNLISANDLFLQVYASGKGQLILQTCILKNGDPSWGRLFITAEPVTEEVQLALDAAQSLVSLSSLGLAQ